MKTIINVSVSAAFFAASAWAGPNTSEIQRVVEKALPALQQAGKVFTDKQACISCHHQTLPAQVTAMAKARGYRYDADIQTQQLQSIMKVVGPAREILLEGSQVVPQIPSTGSYILSALSAQGYPVDANTTAIVNAILMQQRADGSWPGWAPRPPLSSGEIRETAFALRGIDLYAPAGRRGEIDGRIALAQRWLLQAKPSSPSERTAYLQGLVWSKAPSTAIRKAANAVLAEQGQDGGWAQLTTRDSDAFATGEALLALHSAGVLKTSDAAYQRGIAYLLSSRAEDGSWHVKTRAYPFQPLIDTGYPHGRDQWISAAGTSYALMALMLADPVR